LKLLRINCWLKSKPYTP